MFSETQTLISLAWFMAHPGAVVAPQIDLVQADLSDGEKQQLESFVDPNARLPDEMEKLLQTTKIRIELGEIKESFGHAPTDSCA